MNTCEILEILEKYSKKDLLNLIEAMIDNQDLSFDGLLKYIDVPENQMSDNEKIICNKIKLKEELTESESEYVNKVIYLANKRKIGNVLKNKNSFVSFVLLKKIEQIFDQAWLIYPRKVGKSEGAKAFIKLFNDVKVQDFLTTAKHIITKIKNYATNCADNGTEQQFIMHFSTFCNSKRYL